MTGGFVALDIQERGVTIIPAGKASLAPCGAHDAYKQSGNHSIRDTSQFVATARADVLTLQQRGVRASKGIDLTSHNNTNEVSARENSLTLAFPGGNVLGPIGKDTDKVVFTIPEEAAIPINIGAVACLDHDALYPNGTFAALEGYVKATNGMINN
jgi:hypothetical protein